MLQEGDCFFTDDTVMAIGIYNILSRNKKIDQDQLACEFAKNYFLDQNRGYGGTAHSILRNFAAGKHWKEVLFLLVVIKFLYDVLISSK